jgi:hypothetical protein
MRLNVLIGVSSVIAIVWNDAGTRKALQEDAHEALIS